MWKVNIEGLESAYNITEKRQIDTDKTGLMSNKELEIELGISCYKTIVNWCIHKGDVLEFTSTASQYHIRVERV